jgi:type I restriction enzyme S subunit
VSGWKTIPLGDFAVSVDYGVTASATEQAVGPKFLRITDIQNGAVEWQNVPWCVCTERAATEARLNAGDIVFARTGATTGKSFLIRECPADAVFASYLIRVRLGDAVEPRFISHYFQTPNYWAQITKSARGVAQPGVNATILKALEIPLPPLAEQRRIAEVLDRAEALRAKRRDALAQLDALTQAIFLDMFGDPVANRKGWALVKISDVGKLDRGISKHRPRNDPALLGGPYPLVQTGEVSNCGGYITEYIQTYSEFGLRQSKIWPIGTLCITIAANIAKTGILKFQACFPDSVVGFCADDSATVEFIRVWLSFLQKTLEDSAPESAQKNINLAILRDLDVPLPPITLQREFAGRVTAVEKLKAAHRASLAELDALFASLQHRAFRGEL